MWSVTATLKSCSPRMGIRPFAYWPSAGLGGSPSGVERPPNDFGSCSRSYATDLRSPQQQPDSIHAFLVGVSGTGGSALNSGPGPARSSFRDKTGLFTAPQN